MNKPFVSIIIPVIDINDYLRESIPEILKLNYANFEIIILPNKTFSHHWDKTRVIATNTSNPSVKRNIGVQHAHGEIIAFLDDDAYPKKNWLDQAVKHFNLSKTHYSSSEARSFTDNGSRPAKTPASNNIVVAVGGPAITPPADSILQKASGAMSESFIGGGKLRMRFLPVGKTQYVDDWPSVNLLVRKKTFLQSGGFDKRFWPGEDTKLCLELLKYGQIIYEPKAQVYHHRRASLVKHLRQNGNYGLHRGYFARKYPGNSLKLFYLIPSLFCLYLFIILIFIILNLFYPTFYILHTTYYLFPLYLYFFLILIDIIIISTRYKNPLVGVATIPYIIGTHIYYGLRFIKGYFSFNPKSTHHKNTQ